MEQILNFLTIIGSVIVGAVLSHWSTSARFRQEMQWKDADNTRLRLEQLTEVLDEITAFYQALSGRLINKLHFDASPEYDAKRLPLAKLNAIVEMYAPELSPHRKKLRQTLEKYGEIIATILGKRNFENEEKKDLTGKVLVYTRLVEDACGELAKEAARSARERVASVSSNKGFNSDAGKTGAG